MKREEGEGGPTRGAIRARRRIAAIVLPEIVCEVARVGRPSSSDEGRAPLAVLIDDEVDAKSGVSSSKSSDVVDAVDRAARALGVRPGQRVTEATAISAHLTVAHVPRGRVYAALTTIAEVALSFGVVVHVEPLDAVWLDVSGVAHLFGGEERLLEEIDARVSSLGFRASVAIADGPRIAEALARHRDRHRSGVPAIAAPGRGAEALAPLTIGALPLGDEVRSLFARLGVETVGDFARLPRAQVVSRLGARAAEVMALAMGFDQLPLEPYRAPEVLVDETSFEDGVETAPQLLFALRGMTSRLSARLLGRAQATNRIAMRIAYDASIFRLRTADAAPATSAAQVPEVVTVVELPAPLAREGDLLRAIKAKLEQIELVAPAVGLRVELSRVVAAPRVQLDLSRDVTVSPDALPALLSELSAELGPSALGALTLTSTFRPEARSSLVPIGESGVERARLSASEVSAGASSPEPLRLLPEPLPIESLDRAVSAEGRALLHVGHEVFEVLRVVFDRRLDGVEWWAPSSASRDYLRVLLGRPAEPSTRANAQARGEKSAAEGWVVEAWVYVDRRTGESFLQGFWE